MIYKLFKFLFVLLFFLKVEIYSQPKIYIVRHAEKVSGWDQKLTDYQPLSEKGNETSQRLKKYLAEKKISAIFSSAKTRTLTTAFPTSKFKKMKIRTHPGCSDTSKINNLLNLLKEKYNDDESVLIISHSNIIPYFLIKCGLKENEFERLNITNGENWLLTDYYGEVIIIDNKKNIYKEKF